MSAPKGPGAGPRALYRDIHAIIRSRVSGHDAAVAHLALLGVRFGLREQGLRAVLVGAHGTGKSTLAMALAEAVGAPTLMIDVAQMAETNWEGRDLTDAVGELYVRCEREVRRMTRSLVVLDELDKLCTASPHGFDDAKGSGQAYRIGKQTSLLALLSGTAEIPISGSPGDVWSAGESIVLGAGVFSGLPDGEVGPADLVALGIMPELVDRFGSILRLGPLQPAEIREVLRRGLTEIEVVFALMDYALVVDEEALRYVVGLVADPETAYTPRSGASLLKRAAEDSLARMLDGDAPAGSVARVHPDDLRIGGVRGRGRPTGPTGNWER